MDFSEKEIGGQVYRIARLPARTQWNVARRVSPLLEGVVPAIREVLAALPSSDVPTDGGTAEVATKSSKDFLAIGLSCLGPITRALAMLTDDDSDYVITTCLSVVQRRNANGTGWMPFAAKNGQPMFETDDRIDVILPVVLAVVAENLGGFLDVLRGVFVGPPSP